jgi:ribonuclease J
MNPYSKPGKKPFFKKKSHQKQPVSNPASHSVPQKPVRLLEPRDMQQFLLKPKKSSPKSFPYITPFQAFLKHKPIAKEVYKKKAERGVLRIISFGGQEQVGINCVGFEYNNELMIVDMGVQFPDEHMHGVSLRIPDLLYTKGKKVVGICITHGHIDHIGAIPYGMRMLGTHVPVYCGDMAKELIKVKQEEMGFSLNLRSFVRQKKERVGQYFFVEPFTVDHSIPDSLGLRIHTPVGIFIHTGDWKFDSDPLLGKKTTDHELLKRFGKEGVRALLSDSTNAHMTGSSLGENLVIEPLEEIFKNAPGRIITGTFSSIVDRLQIIVDTAQKFSRKVCFLGRGMLTYMDIAKKLGYVKIPQGTLISMEEAEKLPPHQVCICCTGAQGERYAALMRIATGESNDTEFVPGDTVILSSSVIPGNERKVQELMDILYEQGVFVHHYRQSTIHTGGHAKEEDIKQMIQEIRPEIFIPIYGHRFMIHSNANIARNLGYHFTKIFTPRNGQIMEFTKTSARLTEFFASHRLLTLDGYMIGATQEKHLAERHQLNQEGIIIINIDIKSSQNKVFIIPYGFPDLSLFTDLKKEIMDTVYSIYLQEKKEKQDRDVINRKIRRSVQSLIWKHLGKEPVIIITL